MQRVADILDERLRQPGTHASSVFAVPDEATNFIVHIKRGLESEGRVWPTLPGREVVACQTWRSLDGGATWQEAGAIATPGGEFVSRQGLHTETTLRSELPRGRDRLLRIDLICRTPLWTKIDVDFDDTPWGTLETTHSVAYEAGAIASGTAGTTVATGSFTPAGSDRLLIGFCGSEAIPNQTVSSIASSVDGNLDITSPEGFNIDDGGYVCSAGGIKIAPTASACTLTATFSGSGVVAMFVAGVAMSGVDQSTPIGTWSTDIENENPSLSVTSAADDMAISWLIAHDATITQSTGDLRLRVQNIGADGFSAGVSTIAGAAPNVSLGWSSSGFYGIILGAVNVKQSTGAPPDSPILKSRAFQPQHQAIMAM